MRAAPKRIPLVPGFGVSPSRNQSVATLINCYAEPLPGKGEWVALGYPGRDAPFVDREARDRGLYKSDRGTIYGVAGDTLYRLNASDEAESLGTIPGTDRVEWAENRSQIAICANGWVYVFNIATGYFHGVITDSTFKGASSICSVGGWGVYAVPGSDEFYISANGDFREIQALDFATAEARPDEIVAVRAVDNIPWFLGKRTVEPWAPQAKAGFPFARVGVNPAVGCVSRDTALNFNGGLVWLGTSEQSGGLGVYRSSGYGAEKIESYPVAQLLERTRYPERARAHAVSFGGHTFYVLTSDAGSVAYDPASNEWHQCSTGAWPLTGAPPPSQITAQVYEGTRSVVVDELGRLSRMEPGTFTDAGGELVREIVTAPIGAIGRKVVIDRLGLDIEPGGGSLTQPAEVILSLSRDGGHTWDAPRTAQIGLRGQFGPGASWSMLGHANEFAARFRMTGNYPFLVNGAWAEVRMLAQR